MFTSSFKMLNDFVYKQCLEKALDLDNTCFNFKDNFLIEVKESVILLRDSAWRPLLFNSGIIPSSYGQKFMFCPFSIKSPNQLVVDFLQKCTDSKVCFVSAREGLKLPKRALRPLSNTDVSSYLKRILNNEPRKNGVTNTFYYSSEYEFSLGVSNEDAAAAEEKSLHFDGRCVFRVTHMNTFTLVRVAPSPVIKGLDLALSVFSNKKVRPALSISHCERNRNRFGVRCGVWEEKLIILEHENHFVVSAYDSLKLTVKNINKLDEHLLEFEEKFEFCAFCFATNFKGRFRVAVAPLKRGDPRTALLTCGKNEISVIAVYDSHKELEELLNHHYELLQAKESFCKFYADVLLCKRALCPGFKELIRKKGKEIADICLEKLKRSMGEEIAKTIKNPKRFDSDDELAQRKYTEELLDARKRVEARREKEKAAAIAMPAPRPPRRPTAPPRRGKELSSEASKRAGKAAFELDKPLRTAIWEKNREAERAEAAARRAAVLHEETKKRRLAKELPSLEEEFARPAPDLDLMTWRGDVQSLAEARLDLTSARNGEDDDGEGTVADDGVASVAATEDIEISRHALERMMERGVRPEELTNTLREPRIIENRGGARKLIGNEGVTAIVATEGNVITAYRLRTEQR